jgi:uncharacterized protein YbjT (DUF2867 family)
MRIAVVGGTGTVGRHLVGALTQAGHAAVSLSRAGGVDIVSGDGLDDALHGIDALVDVSNLASTNTAKATKFFTSGTRNLLEAERRAGVGHHVLLSIVGIDQIPWGYYEAKVAQEGLALSGEVPVTVLRATQFHEFPGQILARTARGPLAIVPAMLVQSVAAEDVAHVLATAAVGRPAGRLPDLAGPTADPLPELARKLVRARGKHTVVVAVRLPGEAGKAMANGALLPGPDAQLTTQTFDEWLRIRCPA